MTVKVYFSDQAGAPVLTGQVGSLINVLDAVLVNGYNEVNVASMTRSGSTVTVTTSTAHGYENPILRTHNQNGVGNICTIAGAAQTDYNGDWAISYVSDTMFTFNIGAATPVTPATGTMTTKRAGAGFSKAFADTNRAAYRSNDLTSRRHYVQVNDIADCPNGQGARYAGWRGFESMTGIDQWEYPFPTVAGSAGTFGQYFCKSSALDGNSRAWSVFSDGKFFFFWVSPNRSGLDFAVDTYSRLYGFGDFKTTVPDAYGTIISGSLSVETSFSYLYAAGSGCGFMAPSSNVWGGAIPGIGWVCVARRYNGMATPVWAAGLTADLTMQAAAATGLECIGFRPILPWPNPIDNRMYVQQIKVTDGGNIRGSLPYYQGAHGVIHAQREIVNNVVGLEGRTLMFMRAAPGHTAYTGGAYIDITGDANGLWS